jgi:hypothetical protein
MMIVFKNTDVFNFENAIRGARNPMNSWNKSDSHYCGDRFVLGEVDLALAKRLCKAGSDHRKFMRQIFVSVDILAPLYWWKEFDTYKIGTTANSTSTMHKIHSKPFEIKDFSYDKMNDGALECLNNIIKYLEKFRIEFNSTNDKNNWYSIIQLLPSSYNQMRTCTMSYENLVNMHSVRKQHKLNEWLEFCKWIENLPYAFDLIVKTEKYADRVTKTEAVL